MEAAKGMVVKTRNRLVMQLQLKKILQGPDQPVQTYLASLKSVARTCKFQVKCTDDLCGKTVDYTDAMVLQQLIYGLAYEEIQRKLLAKPEMTLEVAEKFVIAEESGKWSQVDSKSDQQMAAGMSRYKSKQVQKKKSCNRCGKEAHSKEEASPASEVQCRKCDRIGHYARVCKSKKDNKSNKDENNAMMEVEVDYQFLGEDSRGGLYSGMPESGMYILQGDL